jgi:hypothetical protein
MVTGVHRNEQPDALEAGEGAHVTSIPNTSSPYLGAASGISPIALEGYEQRIQLGKVVFLVVLLVISKSYFRLYTTGQRF